MKTLTRRETLALLTGSALSACFSDRPDSGTGPGDDTEIRMMPQLVFDPAAVQIEAGQSVVWRNASAFAHTSTADPDLASDPSNVLLPTGAQPWDSGLIASGGEFRRTFQVRGTYRYFCRPHEAQDMVGTIVVV